MVRCRVGRVILGYTSIMTMSQGSSHNLVHGEGIAPKETGAITGLAHVGSLGVVCGRRVAHIGVASRLGVNDSWSSIFQ